MWLLQLCVILIALCCIGAQTTAGPTPSLNTDCETLRARCQICVRSLNEGMREENLSGRINPICQREVGRTFVWRELRRCDMTFLRCRAIDMALTCRVMAELSGMRRRLP